MRGKITVSLKAVEIYLAFRPPPPPSIYNTFPRACDISREGGSKWLERGSKVGYVKKGRRVRAIYDIYLWTRLRDRNPEVVKVGFVTYFPSPPDVEIPIDWRTGVSQFPSRSPDWRGWKQRFTSGKGQNRSRWICIYVWYIAKGGEGASWACSERFSLAFHGMRSCFKILVNLASLSLYICIYIHTYSTYIYRPPYISCRLSFRQCQSRRNRLFPSLPFLSFSLLLLAPFVLVNNAIYIYSTENIRWLTFPPLPRTRWHFRFPHFFLLPFFFFCGLPSPTGSLIDGGKMFSPEPTPGRLFGRPAFLRKFIQRCCASLRSMLHLSRCNAIPPSARWTSPRKNKGKLPSDAILDILFLACLCIFIDRILLIARNCASWQDGEN